MKSASHFNLRDSNIQINTEFVLRKNSKIQVCE